MKTAATDLLRLQLEDRRTRLGHAIELEGPDAELVRLLRQVDSALGRLGTEDYARCLVCDEHVDEEDLKHNPLMEYCLCALTQAQQDALQHDLERVLRRPALGRGRSGGEEQEGGEERAHGTGTRAFVAGCHGRGLQGRRRGPLGRNP